MYYDISTTYSTFSSHAPKINFYGRTERLREAKKAWLCVLGGATRAHGAASARKASAQLKCKGDEEGKNSKNIQTLFKMIATY